VIRIELGRRALQIYVNSRSRRRDVVDIANQRCLDSQKSDFGAPQFLEQFTVVTAKWRAKGKRKVMEQQ
jgi:hypothetical protein